MSWSESLDVRETPWWGRCGQTGTQDGARVVVHKEARPCPES